MSMLSSAATAEVATHNLEPSQAVEQIKAALLASGQVHEKDLRVNAATADPSLWTVSAQGSLGPADSSDPLAFRASVTRTTHVPPRDGRDYSYVSWVNANDNVYSGGNFDDAVKALRSGLFLAQLLYAAERSDADRRLLGTSRAAHMDTVMSFLGDSPRAPSSEMYTELRNVADGIATGQTLLTSNSGAYHAFGSDVPSGALLSLQRIVQKAGFPCAIARQANIRVAAEHPDREGVLRILEDIKAQPLGITQPVTSYSLNGMSDQAVVAIRELEAKKEGVSLELWPALVLNKKSS